MQTAPTLGTASVNTDVTLLTTPSTLPTAYPITVARQTSPRIKLSAVQPEARSVGASPRPVAHCPPCGSPPTRHTPTSQHQRSVKQCERRAAPASPRLLRATGSCCREKQRQSGAAYPISLLHERCPPTRHSANASNPHPGVSSSQGGVDWLTLSRDGGRGGRNSQRASCWCLVRLLPQIRRALLTVSLPPGPTRRLLLFWTRVPTG